MSEPGFWRVVFALLRAARQRGAGRAQRNLKLAKNRRVAALFRRPGLLFVLGALFGAVVHLSFAAQIATLVDAGGRMAARTHGDLMVSARFLAAASPKPSLTDKDFEAVAREALRRARGAEAKAYAYQLANELRAGGKRLRANDEAWRAPYPLPDRLALVWMLWWAIMLICQSESARPETVEIRRPMWDWLFSHPAPPAAIYFAEMLAPIAANPVYFTAPLLPMVLFAFAYGPFGVLAGLGVGVAFTVALACVGRGIEFGLISRLSVRARGAVFGLMNVVGFGSLMGALLLGSPLMRDANAVARFFAPLAALPLPPARALIGLGGDGGLALWRALALDAALAATLIVGAVAFSVRAARIELTGFAPAATARPRSAAFSRRPLFTREWLWFRRDGSAVVQALIAPLLLAGVQAMNFRGLAAGSLTSWNGMAGAAILFGTYLLLTLGPKSLASDGQALWIALTWPQGLESLLKAKARLWSGLASVVVLTALGYTLWRFPADAAAIALTAALWLAFAGSLSQKMVTLAAPVSASGEAQPPPALLRWAATLGLLSFAIGVMTKQPSLAISGVVYSMLTAAAMWQAFRFRLPYLFDPWSEVAPPPPTLLHAMIAISAMIEGASLLTAAGIALFGRDVAALLAAASYGIAALVVCAATVELLRRRGVGLFATLALADARGGALLWIAAGLAAGAALGGLAHLYLDALRLIPAVRAALEPPAAPLRYASAAYAVMAIAFAPFAEEYLFRALLYRALAREWGEARAVIGSAAFFALYHPPLSWAPVFALGALNAILFRRSGRLATSVAAHIAYNAVVLGF